MAYIKFSFDSIRHKQYWTRLVGNWQCKFLWWNLMENPKKLAVTCCQMQCYLLLECINSSTKCCFWVSESSITLGYNLPQRRYDNGAKIQYNYHTFSAAGITTFQLILYICSCVQNFFRTSSPTIQFYWGKHSLL